MSEMKIYSTTYKTALHYTYVVKIQGLEYDLSYYIKLMSASDEYDGWYEVVGVKMNQEEIFKADPKLKLVEENLNLCYEKLKKTHMFEAIKDFKNNFKDNFEEMKEKLKWYEKYDKICFE